MRRWYLVETVGYAHDLVLVCPISNVGSDLKSEEELVQVLRWRSDEGVRKRLKFHGVSATEVVRALVHDMAPVRISLGVGRQGSERTLSRGSCHRARSSARRRTRWRRLRAKFFGSLDAVHLGMHGLDIGLGGFKLQQQRAVVGGLPGQSGPFSDSAGLTVRHIGRQVASGGSQAAGVSGI